MIRLPDGFVLIKYPGYYWNCYTQELYSIKVGGVLKQMKRRAFKGWVGKGVTSRYLNYDGYTLSHQGNKVTVSHRSLERKVYDTRQQEFIL